MLAGCSSTLLSPRHRLIRSEASTQFQAGHIPAMSTQRLDIPCSSFARKEAASRAQPVRPVGLSIDKPAVECSLKQNIRLPPSPAEGYKDEFWGTNRSIKKRFADEDTTCKSRVKRKRGNEKPDSEGHFSLGQDFWIHQGEEERVCFAPNDVISPPLPPLSSIPWFESVVTEVTDLGEKNVGTVRSPEKEEGSGSSSTSSGSHGLVLSHGGNPKDGETGNGSSLPNPGGIHRIVVEESNHREHECVELISLLVACAEQVGLKNIPAINHCLARLGELALPRNSPIHRLIAYFTEAMALRVARLWPHIFHITIPRELDRVDDDNGTALRLLNQVSPIPKFIHFTGNEILLRAFEGKDRIHIIDFDIKQGLQWPGLFQSLASRANPPSHVRITGVGDSKQDLVATGSRLAGFAEVMNLPFEFHPVADGLEDVRLWMLHVKEHETVAVNCMLQLHRLLYDTTGGTLRDFLGLIRSTKAEVVILAEQEAAHNELNLNARLCNSLKYYSAIFDSLDSSLPMDSMARIKIEEMFAHEIRNIISCEGHDRFERHEGYTKWQQLMEQGGFRCMAITERELLQGQMMLRMYSSESYRVEETKQEEGSGSSLTLKWLDQPLYTVSAWTPVDAIAGSSSLSSSQPS